MQNLEVTIKRNSEMADNYCLLEFSLPDHAEQALAGQFLTLRIGDHISPLLRRPFAYASYSRSSNCASILYERRGRSTHMLSGMRPGDTIDLIGPLGKPFPLPHDGTQPVLIAGGIGIGPMLFLYHSICQTGIIPRMIIGARSQSKIPMDLLPEQAIICTDDGSSGIKGTVINGLAQLSGSIGDTTLEMFACGPNAMMKAVHLWSQQQQTVPRLYVSMEQTMACAVGACMGCVMRVNHEKQYARVCIDGPVFDSTLIAWQGL